MPQDANSFGSTSLTKEKPARCFSKWWFVLLALPFGFILQIALNTTFSTESNRAVFLAALIIDAVLFMRAVVGLIWQPHSSDWRSYLLFLMLSVPFVMLVAGFGSAFAR